MPIHEEEFFPIGIQSLDDFCSEHPKLALAFSGGCDSSYLLSVLLDRGLEIKAYYVDTAFQAEFELDDARRVVEQLNANFEIIKADILSQPQITANTSRRCYYCKRFIFGTIIEHMYNDGFEVLVDGTNASDDPQRRPGFRALHELQVYSPLRRAGLTKEEVRELSRQRGLITAEKPSYSCLATKVTTGDAISKEKLDELAGKEKGWSNDR